MRAPARVNIIGEHTDYNGGLVMPTGTALYTTVIAVPRSDRIVAVRSREMQATGRFSLDDMQDRGDPGWIDYVKGVAAELGAAGVKLCGADLLVESDIPLGRGLSSSASFELAVAAALLALCGRSMERLQLAMLCQQAEHRYAGVNCGIMDQFAVACCEANKAMLLDCSSLDNRQAVIPDSIRFLIVDSGVRHHLRASGYNERAQECAEAVAILANASPSLAELRDADMQMLETRRKQLGEVLFRRCRHVVSENRRVRDAFAALTGGNIRKLGELINDSHASLRDDFEVSCPEVDRLVAIANETDGVLGARMVGAGFGGCVLSLVETGKIDDARRRISNKYGKELGNDPWMHVVAAADPASLPVD